ncbi:MAG: hypothetical protein Q7J43_18590 [Pseudomonas sp.]|uniref:hypothetical protein n=1 Tax=Pseudomonas sp. TaxID=306 RepID=UPI00271F548B|nr:hypothetical protein [Pseudomonas sp.]MDO9619681.1 hypothetical protein [Pseudomonas sp.]MDP2444488.1 hypothetical protein [Pseudomonas sp.]MDZ4335595.1 hypothetical protein [Pseudomonas sp.]
MSLVARRVQPLEQSQDGEKRLTEQPLSDFRDTPAWVLLGEPGAGKSEALNIEAEATGGHYLTARELITANPIPGQWRGKTLFIDALDESRAEGVDSLTLRISNQLRNLDCPAFRLACRAADWYGPSDRTDLQHLSPDGKLITLQLCPLNDEDIRHILRSNHGIADAEGFAERTKRHGIAPLLRNPQTLSLIAKAIREEQWPDNRADVYRLACETLAQETNRRHRNAQRNAPTETLAILQAAGQLFSVLLLAGKSGIALDQDASNSEFPTLQQLLPADTATATKALQSALFIPAANHDERLLPCHRSVAEHLAADWLGKRLDSNELPLGRLLNLLLGCDGGVVADLRGLFAWLAQCSALARPRLIDIDPLGIVLYGDARPLSTADKRHLLQALRQQAEHFPGFRWYLHHDQEAFGALADQALTEDFRQILQDPQRDEATQALMDCVLDILRYGGAIPALTEPLLAVVKDATLWFKLRNSALDSLLTLTTPLEAKAYLMTINSGQVEDDDNRLLEKLLEHLYPAYLEPDELLQCLHPKKDSRQVGGSIFWEYQLPERVPDHHLSALLIGLSQRRDMFRDTQYDGDLSRATGQLVARALEALGDDATDEQITTWLGSGADEYGRTRREQKAQAVIQKWLERRPERYKAVLGIAIQSADQGRNRYRINLPHMSPPADLGLWHLQQATHATEVVARIHLREAIEAINLKRGDQGLTLETLAEWIQLNPGRAAWVEELLVWPVEEWRLQDAARTREYRHKRQEARHTRTLNTAPYLPAITAGTAAPHLLDQLAGVWLNHFSDIHGETPSDRFANYSEFGDELMQAAESGFKLSLQRDDLPSADEIIALGLKKRRHWISKPCLLGLQLLWENDPKQVQPLPDNLVERLLAFRLNMPLVEIDAWLAQTARQRPELFADLLVRYAGAAFKAGETSVELIHLLGKNDDYAQVSALAAPQLLRNFPLRAKKDQLHSLKRLLNTALAAAPSALEELARHKLSLKGVDAAQKTLWFAVALLLNPEHQEQAQALWRHIGTSPTRASLLTEFICQGFDNRASRASMPAHTLGRLIELIAPHAEMELGRRSRTEAWERGDLIRAMVDQLGASISEEAEQELQRLLAKPDLSKLRYTLQRTLDQQRTKRREAQFSFLTPEAVAQVLFNRAPANVDDLTALAIDHLDEIAHELRHENDDGYRSFWNITQGTPPSQRDENLCRDALLQRLRPRLSAQGVGIAPEADHAADKRADLQLDYRNQSTLPIEIKRDSHPDLWKALRNQLMAQYVNAPKTQGHGIYLVLWFGDPKKPMPATLDGGKKPKSAQELQARLEALLNEEERQRVFVRVLDVSWPT